MSGLAGRIAVVALGVLVMIGRAEAATPEQVEAAVGKAVKWLISQQKEGNWEQIPKADPTKAAHEVVGGQWGGLTALSTFALLSAGQDPKSEPIQSAIKFLKTADIKGTYALGLRCQVWALLPASPENRSLLLRDAQLIRDGRRTGGEERGMFSYFNDRKAKGHYDHSTSNYAVLGLWSAAQAGVMLTTEEWGSMEDGWKRHQAKDGSWGYVFGGSGDNATTMSMTSAGVATLFITQDQLHAAEFIRCNGTVVDENIARGMEWMAANFDNFQKLHPYYTLYNVERVGSASGFKYFGTVDWYEKGSQYLMNSQGGGGNWGALQDTCFGVLFLVRGRAPIVINKLDYTPDVEPGKLGEDDELDQRPRDAANISRWVGKQMETELRWQIINLKATEAELHEAPILYMAGKDELKLGAEEEAKLKQWIEQGGLLLGNADCDKPAFAMSFRRMGERMFPGYKFREVPLEHPIYTEQQFKRTNWKMQVRVLGLSNGVRELMLIPEQDLGKVWQTQAWRGTSEAVAQFVADVFQYQVDKKMRFRGQTHLVAKEEKIVDQRTIKLARLNHGGNWDPEPWGWKRLPVMMHNDFATNVEATPVKLGDGSLSKAYQAAHLTGTGKLDLSATSKEELKKFVEGGGTLIVDAAGGDGEFGVSAENAINGIFAPAKLAMLKADHPVYATGGKEIGEIDYRNFALKAVGKATTPRVKGLDVGGRTAVLLSTEDISAGLMGHSVDGIVGYDPKSAAKVMQRLLLHAGGVKLTAQDLAKIEAMVKGPAVAVVAPATPGTPAAPVAPTPVKRETIDLTSFMEKFGSGWTVAGTGKGEGAGWAEEMLGQKGVLVTYPVDAATPVVLTREMGIPPRKMTIMHLFAGHAKEGSWELAVKVDGNEVTKKTIGGTSDGWVPVDVDLSASAGKRVKVELVQTGKGLPGDVGYWRAVELEVK